MAIFEFVLILVLLIVVYRAIIKVRKNVERLQDENKNLLRHLKHISERLEYGLTKASPQKEENAEDHTLVATPREEQVTAQAEEVLPKVVPTTQEEEHITIPIDTPHVAAFEQPEETILSDVEIPVLPTAEVTHPTISNKEYKVYPPKKNENVIFNQLIEQGKKLLAMLGKNILAKVGILTLIFGVGFLVKYAIDQNWINEVGRVSIGFLIGAGVVGVGHRLRINYNVFSSILVGGGLAILYVTVTLAFQQYALFSQTVAFLLLIIITLFAVAISLLYDRQELAIFSLIGGFIAPILISTGSGNYMVLFSYIFLLNAGMLLISTRKRWNTLPSCSYVFTLLLFWAWLVSVPAFDRLGTLFFAVLFFAQFYALFILRSFKQEVGLSRFQIVLLFSNNLSVFAAAMFLLSDELAIYRGVATIALALINGAILYVMNQKKVNENLLYLLIAVVLTFVSVAVPIQLEGKMITMFWAVEAVALLWLWKRTRMRVLSLGHSILLLLSIIALGVDYVKYYTYEVQNIIFNSLFLTSAVLLASMLVAYRLLRKEEDSEEFFAFKPLGYDLRLLLGAVKKILALLIMVLLFIAPFMEIDQQLGARISAFASGASVWDATFKTLMLAAYTVVFTAGFALWKQNTMGKRMLIIPTLVFFAYSILASMELTHLSWQVVYYGKFSKVYMAWALVGMVGYFPLLYVLLVQGLKWFKKKIIPTVVLVALATSMFSAVLVTVVLLLAGSRENLFYLTDSTTSYGYPILWGVLAMILMLWGLKKNILAYRRVALLFFAIIILKFYIFDVWNMPPVGRVVSFILLGVILLVVSFMQEKIKVLVKDDDYVRKTTTIDETIETTNKEIN